MYVRADEKDYLDNDSYVDCSELKEISKEEITEALKKDPGHVLGTVKLDDLKKIMTYINDSPKITPKKLKKYRLK